jgi:putative ABC transport system permease protein
MLKNHILLAFRHLKKEKGYTLVSILGLALAFAVSFFTINFAIHEFSPDENFNHSESIVRLNSKAAIGDHTLQMSHIPTDVGNKLTDRLPELERVVPISGNGDEMSIESGGRTFWETNVVFTNHDFIDLFDSSYFSIKGDFSEGTAIVNSSLSRKLFGNANPVGEIIQLKGEYFKVAGTFNDFPSNSHLQIKAAAIPMPYSPLSQAKALLYFRMKKGSVELEELEAKANEIFSAEQEGADLFFTYFFHEAESLYERGYASGIEKGANMFAVKLMLFCNLFILILSLSNVVSHTQVKSIYRSKEVGIKKVMGVSRKYLFIQFSIESLLIVAISLLLALSIIQLVGRDFNAYLKVTLAYYPATYFLLVAIAFFVVALLAFSQNALFAGVNPRKVIAGDFKVGSKKYLVKGLLGIQFLFASLLMGGALLVNSQMSFIANRPLGFQVDDLWYLHSGADSTDLRLFKNEIEGIPQIASSTISSAIPFGPYSSIYNDQAKDHELVSYCEIDGDFFKTYGMSLVDNVHDLPSSGFFLNQSADQKKEDLALAGSPKEPLLGVVEDFHIRGLDWRIEPLKLSLESNSKGYLSMRIPKENVQLIRATLQRHWEALYPNQPFELLSLKNLYLSAHESAANMEVIFNGLSLLAVFLSIVGLSALASYFVKRRKKEMAIRKVLGASVEQIIGVVNYSFFVLIVSCSIAAIPFLNKFGNDWLDDFAYHIDLDILLLILPGLIITVIATGIMILQTWKTARTNPVEALRTE